MIRGPKPETVRDYVLRGREGDQTVELVRVEGNDQRLRRHGFEPITLDDSSLEVAATNGAKEARVFEVRCYA